jgi:hypothetical protein
MRSGFPSPKETMLLYHQGKDHEHYNFGDQGSFMIYAKGAPLVLHFGSVYQPQFRGAWYFNRPCLGHATEVEDTTGTVTAFATLPTSDFVRGEHRCTKQGLCPDDAREPLPPNTPLPERAIPPTLWTRRILFLKDADVDGPNYFVIRDDYSEQPTLPSEWNLWGLATEVVVNENGKWKMENGNSETRKLGNSAQFPLLRSPISQFPNFPISNLITLKGQHGVDLDVFMAAPAQPEWTTRQDRHEFLAGPSMEYWRAVNGDKPWQETMWNVRTTQPVGQGYLAVLYPRRAEEAGAEYAAFADGAGVQVVTPRGTDRAFLSLKPVQWSGEGASFSGTAGAIRRADAETTLLLAEAGVVSGGGVTLQSAGPASAVVQGQRVFLHTHGPAQTLRLILPAGASARATHDGQALALKRDGPAWLIPVTAGEQEVEVMW